MQRLQFKISCAMALMVLVLSLGFLPTGAGSSAGQEAAAATKDLNSMDQQELQAEKTRQEVLKLQRENETLKSPWTRFSSNAGLITALVALVGVFITIWKQLYETRRQRELDRKQRDLDREQREIESQRRLDEKFNAVVTSLGSESEAIRASAAVSIVTFLKPEYEALHDQVYTILLANLKIQHSDAVNRLLVEAFEKALRRRLDVARKGGGFLELDLARANLTRANLSKLDLRDADLGFTQLRLADLTEANLFRARGYEANLEKARLSRANLGEGRLQKARLTGAFLHEANLVAADLKEADLTHAQLQQASMQSAHLEGATIQGARFEEANLKDTYFQGAKLDRQTKQSLTRARFWRDAHFDDAVKAELEEIEKGSRQGGGKNTPPAKGNGP